MQQTLEKQRKKYKYLSGATTCVAKNNLVEAIDAFAQLVATRRRSWSRSWWRRLFATHCNSRLLPLFPRFHYRHNMYIITRRNLPILSLRQTRMRLCKCSFFYLSFSLFVFGNHFLFTFFFINFLFLLFLGILLARRELQTVVEYVLSNRVNLDSYLSFFALINNSFYVIFLIDDEYILL